METKARTVLMCKTRVETNESLIANFCASKASIEWVKSLKGYATLHFHQKALLCLTAEESPEVLVKYYEEGMTAKQLAKAIDRDCEGEEYDEPDEPCRAYPPNNKEIHPGPLFAQTLGSKTMKGLWLDRIGDKNTIQRRRACNFLAGKGQYLPIYGRLMGFVLGEDSSKWEALGDEYDAKVRAYEATERKPFQRKAA